MDIEKMCEEFDEWASTHEIRCAFDVWKASRESLVIKLPSERKIRHQPHIDENTAYNEAIENCRDAIEDSGLKVKS